MKTIKLDITTLCVSACEHYQTAYYILRHE